MKYGLHIKKALQKHPDKGGSNEAFRSLLVAFETLSSARLRWQHDLKLGLVDAEAHMKSGRASNGEPPAKTRRKGEIELKSITRNLEKWLGRLRFEVAHLSKEEQHQVLSELDSHLQKRLLHLLETNRGFKNQAALVLHVDEDAEVSDTEGEGAESVAFVGEDTPAETSQKSCLHEAVHRRRLGHEGVSMKSTGEYISTASVQGIVFVISSATLMTAIELHSAIMMVRHITEIHLEAGLPFDDSIRRGMTHLQQITMDYRCSLHLRYHDRWWTGKCYIFGAFATLEEALDMRQLLKVTRCAWADFRSFILTYAESRGKFNKRTFNYDEVSDILTSSFQQNASKRVNTCIKQAQHWLKEEKKTILRAQVEKRKEANMRFHVLHVYAQQCRISSGSATMAEILKAKSC